MPAPATLHARGDETCTPVSYTISDYTLTTSPTSGAVNFTIKSLFSIGSLNDSVQSGAHCSASGTSVPNSNECQVANRRLLFDLRGPQDQAYYQITHTWSCNGGTWMSGNAVKIDPLNCYTEGNNRVCTGGPQTFAPQNVRKICSTPTC
ncbi:hypersensitive response inducing 1 [Pyrenophora seminiperda CCB06]|uniref:Hypersensitive response inducing 1 n=1 Tax=Pyrenophora seminiperda CCB06 TaxID=1302712 RepID=A0A3M7MG06_9PLEO|nr:hypersensitive response inducing 1 [Pyrenophora seminiperda CCB06]